jgi:allophanate hydrolase
MRPIVPGRGAAGPGTLFAVAAAHRIGQPGDGVQTLARVLPEPLVIGPVQPASGSPAVGISCRRRPAAALDITEHGSWPAYLAARDPVSGRTTSTAAG